ncbi:hypothetical protein Salat_1701200 [Sesamum alatum]|uniref:Uncharacterized protein n=1 Tax=Sesamum alatum TaxID=300844 RepID=A0AAE2CK23_9LAMI|nr:hypothetical protein Salat_1701200 [Sesamum alatum]
MHVVRILFYPSDRVVNGKHLTSLEESLSQVLPLFYPLAGRYHKEKHYVDCNDEGAEFSIAEVDCQLHQLIGPEVKTEQLNHLLPLEIGEADELTDPMLAVQINKFQCGGLAIGISTLPRTSPLRIWPRFNLGCRESETPVFSPRGLCSTKNAIYMLARKVEPEWRNERPPSRVVVVSAVLTQAILRADRKKHGKSRASIIGQAVNVRERTIPPISKYACGTWASMSFLESTPKMRATAWNAISLK